MLSKCGLPTDFPSHFYLKSIICMYIEASKREMNYFSRFIQAF